MSVGSISMPEVLLEHIDEFVDEHGYSGWSEVIRGSTRTLFEEFQARNVDGQQHIYTVTVVFEYCQPTIQRRLTGVQHEYDAIVSAVTHSYVGNQYCMELFVLEEITEAISGFVNTIRAVPDILAVDYPITSLSEGFRDHPIQT
ncbi:CopG family ribbon-helix-helix protein [Natrinema soli]|uniref:CopG family ribbon-helix-helix protein n=1 Tax=Natrinema soli TaxID=1930624 RepID=A0ABD5SSG2_9EURY|nr:CopG family ribbon-helix-helix protein [Natrinema soli]